MKTRGKKGNQKKTSAAASAVVAEEKKQFEQIVNGEKLIFEMVDGELELVKKIPLSRDKNACTRYFKLKLIRNEKRKSWSGHPITYKYKGYKKFYQGNGEWMSPEERDPDKENIVAVTEADALYLSTMTNKFEEVFDHESVARNS